MTSPATLEPDPVAPDVRLRNQRVMVATVFVVFTGFAFVIPFLPLYVRELGVRDDASVALWSGVLIGIAPLLAGLLAPAWGAWADRHGRKRAALRALIVYTALVALSGAVTSVVQLLVLRIGIGLAGVIGPLSMAMATEGTPRHATGHAVGLVQAAQILAAAVGPLLGGALADTAGVRAPFLVTAVLCAAAWVLVALGYQETPRASASDTGGPAALGTRAVLALPGVAALVVVLFFVNFIGRSFTPILPLHLIQLGVPRTGAAWATGVAIAVYSIAAALSAAVLGRAAGRVSARGLLLVSLLAGAAVTLPIVSVESYAQFLGLAVLLGLASGGALTLGYTIGSGLVPEGRRGTAFGVFSAAALFGGAVSPSLAGFVARVDLLAIYPIDAVLFVALAVLLALAPPPAATKASAERA